MYLEKRGFSHVVDKWENWWQEARNKYDLGLIAEAEKRIEQAISYYKQAANKGLCDASEALKKHGINYKYELKTIWSASRVEI